MNATDLQILEMYYGGMDAEVIADELRLSVCEMNDREAALLNALNMANEMLERCDQYISAEPSRLFKWFCIGLSIGFLIGRFV